MEGVTLNDCFFKELFVNNHHYLLRLFTLNDLLHTFYVRAGKDAPERSRPAEIFWETELEGSNAGRFLMGAGYTLCFEENPQLRERMDQLVDGIGACAEEDGFCMGYPKSHMMILERIKDKEHRHYDCPKCRQPVRVPRGKGKIAITCPKCKEKFIRKT